MAYKFIDWNYFPESIVKAIEVIADKVGIPDNVLIRALIVSTVLLIVGLLLLWLD